MSLNTSYPSINPRLGTSFSIFTSAFASLVLILIILEQLGLERSTISQLIIILPVLFYLGIGIYVRTSNVDDFFISGQRVPPVYAGFALSANLIGGASLIGLIGAFFFIGYDALPIALGWIAGLGLMSVLLAPYLRKAGAFTLPAFFGIRFGSKVIRLVAAILLFPPVIMLLAAELRAGQMIASVFLPQDAQFLLQIGLVLLVLTVIFGGMRSLSWTQCAQFIVVLLGIAVPLIAISIVATNLPLPQLSYGVVLDNMAELEVARGLIERGPVGASQALPPILPTELTRQFTELFGAMGSGDFLMLTLAIMLGVSVLPVQIARLSTTPTVAGIRKSFGWAGLFVGFMVLTIPAFAAFTKYEALQQLVGVPLSQIPDWGQRLAEMGLINLSGNQLDPALGKADVFFNRDLVAIILPIMNEFPFVIVGVIGAAAIAATFAAAGAQLVALGNTLSHDIYYLMSPRSASSSRRLLVGRLGMILFAIIALSIATQADLDPLRMVLWAISLCAGAFFAPLVLAIWWRKLTPLGAMAGMAAGFGVTMLYIVSINAGGFQWFGVDGLAAGVIGVPVSMAVSIGVSYVTPLPDQAALETIDEIHVPSGETAHARLLRLAARGKALRP